MSYKLLGSLSNSGSPLPSFFHVWGARLQGIWRSLVQRQTLKTLHCQHSLTVCRGRAPGNHSYTETTGNNLIIYKSDCKPHKYISLNPKINKQTNRVTRWCSNSTSTQETCPRQTKTYVCKNLYTEVYSSIIHSSQKVETIQTDELSKMCYNHKWSIIQS